MFVILEKITHERWKKVQRRPTAIGVQVALFVIPYVFRYKRLVYLLGEWNLWIFFLYRIFIRKQEKYNLAWSFFSFLFLWFFSRFFFYISSIVLSHFLSVIQSRVALASLLANNFYVSRFKFSHFPLPAFFLAVVKSIFLFSTFSLYIFSFAVDTFLDKTCFAFISVDFSLLIASKNSFYFSLSPAKSHPPKSPKLYLIFQPVDIHIIFIHLYLLCLLMTLYSYKKTQNLPHKKENINEKVVFGCVWTKLQCFSRFIP